MKRRTNKKGFTIVELVIVIAVIAILATTLVPTFSGIINKANESAAKQAAKNAYTEYLIEAAGKGEVGSYFVYQANTDCYVAIQNGSVVGVYETQKAAFEKLVGIVDESKIYDTGDGKLFVYGAEPVKPSEPEKPTPVDKTVQDGPLYMWNIDKDGAIESVSGSCLTEKKFTNNTLEEEIVLEIDKPWQISWFGSHVTDQYTLLLCSKAGMVKGSTYIFFGKDDIYGMTIGRYHPENGKLVNYGFHKNDLKAYEEGKHTYTICNEWDGAGYHIKLYIDGNDIGVMKCVQDQTGLNLQDSEVDFDFVFGAFGAQGIFVSPTSALCDNLLINTASGDSEVTHTMLEKDGALHCTVCPCVIEERLVQDGPIYKWNFDENGVIQPVTGECLTVNGISATNVENRYYTLTNDITLKAGTSWEISWTGAHVIPGYYTVPLCSKEGMTVNGTTYIFLGGTGGEGLFVGKYVNGQPVNYGFSRQTLLDVYGVGEGTHTYIIRSEDTDGTYQVNLYIDGKLIGPMRNSGRDVDFDLVFGATGGNDPFWTPKNFENFTINVGGANSQMTHTVISGTGYAHCLDCGSVNVDRIAIRTHTFVDAACTHCGKTNALDGQYISIIGDSISTFNGVSNDTAVRSDLSQNGSQHYNSIYSMDRNDTYWQQTINHFGMNLCVNNSIAGGKVAGEGTDRAGKLATDAGQDPDIILFYMGINDAGLVGDVDSFATAYRTALETMKSEYSAEIFCLTLLPQGHYAIDSTLVNQYNDKIREIAIEKGATVIDIATESGITWDNYQNYMHDKIHPTKAGMDLIANAIIEALEERYVR